MAALAPSTEEELLESIDARWSSVRRRPFRVLAGAHETPDRLSLDMQRETDRLLTHALAVQVYYLVVPVNPALATIFAIVLESALGLRKAVSWWRCRFPHRHQHNRFRQGGVLRLQDPLYGGGQITEQMKTIGHLNRLRGSTGGAIGIDPAPITADNFRPGMRFQPRSQAICRAVRQQVNGGVRFKVDQDGPITLPFAPSPIVDAHSLCAADLYGGPHLQSPQNGVRAGCHTKSI